MQNSAKSYLNDSLPYKGVSTTVSPAPNSEVDSKEEEVNDTEDWPEKNGLEDDTYGSILLNYCGLRDNKIAVTFVENNLSDGRVALSFVIPVVDIPKIMMVDVCDLRFTYDNSMDLGTIMAEVSIVDYEGEDFNISADDSPDYDSSEETPLDVIDWEEVLNLFWFNLHMSQATYDKLFPSVI